MPLAGAFGQLIRSPSLVIKTGPAAERCFDRNVQALHDNRAAQLAFLRNVGRFCQWLEDQHVASLTKVEPRHFAAFTQWLANGFAEPTIKQHRVTIRRLFDALVVDDVIGGNPTRNGATRMPRQIRPEMTPERAGTLMLAAMRPTGDTLRLRDRALISLVFLAGIRLPDVLSLRMGSCRGDDRGCWLRPDHEGVAPDQRVALDPAVWAVLEQYRQASGLAGRDRAPLFPAARGAAATGAAATGAASRHEPLTLLDARKMIQRRAAAAGLRWSRWLRQLTSYTAAGYTAAGYTTAGYKAAGYNAAGRSAVVRRRAAGISAAGEMKPGEMRLGEMRLRLVKAEELVERQRSLVARLQARGQSSILAEQLLDTLKQTLAAYRQAGRILANAGGSFPTRVW